MFNVTTTTIKMLYIISVKLIETIYNPNNAKEKTLLK